MSSDVLELVERIRNEIQLGESQFTEFKSALEGRPGAKKPRQLVQICRDIGNELVAFANADGGVLVVGVEDDRTVTGVPHSEEEIERMLGATKSHVFAGQALPMIDAAKVEIDGHSILFFSVSKGTSQIYQLPDGRCVRRRDRESLPVAFDKIQFERREIVSREYERQFVDGASVNDLDLDEVQIAANAVFPGMSPSKYLQQAELGEYTTRGLRLRMAALLLFAKDSRRWAARSEIRILRILGDQLGVGESYNAKEDIPIYGNILQLLRTGWQHFQSFLVERTTLGVGARFESKFSYPELACQEALINALAHRDYSIHNPIEIHVYNSRLEIKTPGALLSTVSIEDLKQLQGVHESRNAIIARVLKEQRVMRELGEGMRRIFGALEENDFAAPILHSNGNSFTIKFESRSLYTDAQLAFLSQFEGRQLSRLQKRILVAGMNGGLLSRDMIRKAMGTSDRDTYDQEITGLRQKNLLRQEVPMAAAKAIAVKQRTDADRIGRFRVVSQADRNERPEAKSLPRPSRQLFPERTGVYVKNFPASTTDRELSAPFSRFGPVRQINRRLNHFGPSAIIWFETEEQAKQAIDGLYGTRIGNDEIQLSPFRSKPAPKFRLN
jgi:ATP-dependent DNA helicase RecG